MVYRNQGRPDAAIAIHTKALSGHRLRSSLESSDSLRMMGTLEAIITLLRGMMKRQVSTSVA